jgi:hypothetical protein
MKVKSFNELVTTLNQRTIKSSKPINHKFEIGDKVHSRKVGKREAFNGIIARRAIGSDWVVKDENGYGWDRDWRELTPGWVIKRVKRLKINKPE